MNFCAQREHSAKGHDRANALQTLPVIAVGERILLR